MKPLRALASAPLVMNYFEMFDIAPTLVVDAHALKPRFFALQRKYHPDHTGSDDGADMSDMLELSAKVNAAWKTLNDPDALMQYVLQLAGVLEPDEKYSLPPDFLMAVMELNEQKMDGAPAETIAAEVDRLQQEIYAPIANAIATYGPNTSPAVLAQIKLYYFQKKYLDRLMQQ